MKNDRYHILKISTMRGTLISLAMYILQFLTKYLRLLYVLAQLPFTSEMELDYYHQKLNVQAASQVGEKLKT